MGIDERFWSKVDKTSVNGCWLWTAHKNKGGYGKFRMDGEAKLAHRVSYLLSNGHLPDDTQIDHMCHNRSCVNPSHLRLASFSENMRNSLMKKTNQSGYKGVTWKANNQKWQAKIMVNKHEIYLGLFNTPEEAFSAYCKAALKYHGEFACFGLAS